MGGKVVVEVVDRRIDGVNAAGGAGTTIPETLQARYVDCFKLKSITVLIF